MSSTPAVTPHTLARAIALLLAALAALVPAAVAAAPEPSPIPIRWEFRFEHDPLRTITLELPDGSTQTFLYLTYRVANLSGEDRLFAPTFELVADDGDIRRSGRGVPAAATRQLIELLEDPRLVDQLEAVSLLLQGRENTRHGVVLWPAVGLQTDDLRLFVSGLSGEYRSWFTTDPLTGDPERVFLRKTKMLTYPTPGEIDLSRQQTFRPVDDTWVMR